jgi:SAM-dependent methyltransferase
MRRFADYDPFAWLYANYWGEDFHREAVPVLDYLLLHLLPRKAEILDVCCGDGRIARSLSKRGYRIVGVDGSEQMLSYAKQRAPKAEFYLKDVRNFEFPPRFDAAISTFDSLNHIMSIDELKRVFENVSKSLKPEGYFVFDLNREEAYIDLWARTTTLVDKRAVSVARGTYESAFKIANCDVTLMRLENGQWVRSDFRLTQKLHAEEDVLAGLQEAGFDAKVFDATSELNMHGDIGAGRNFYLARKRSQDS